MTDRDHTDAVFERVAVLVFLVPPRGQIEEPHYRREDVVRWCLDAPTAWSST